MTTKYMQIEGLRATLAIIVVIQHFMNTFYPFLSGDAEWSSVYKYNNIDHPLRATPLRIFIAGTWPVTMFYIISGFTMSLGFFKGIGKNQLDAFHKLRASWIKRYIRLVAPLLAISWLYHVVYRTGGFQIADQVSVTTASNWLGRYSVVWDPDGVKHWSAFRIDILDIPYFLYETLIGVFVFQSPRYAVQFWPIPIFFAGSILTYGILFTVGPMKPQHRFPIYAIIIVGMFVPPWMGGMDRSTLRATGMLSLFVAGLIIADLETMAVFKCIPRWLNWIISLSLGYLVIFMGSYPQVFPERVISSYWHSLIFNHTINYSGYVYPYSVASTAALLVCLLSPIVIKLLSLSAIARWGKISYEIYLIHCLFMFSTVPLVFSWLSATGIAYDAAAILSFVINFPLIIAAAALCYYEVTLPIEAILTNGEWQPIRRTLLKYALFVGTFMLAIFMPLRSPPGGCLMPLYRAQLSTQQRIYNWFTVYPERDLSHVSPYMYIMRNDYPIKSDRVKPLYEHYTCGYNGSMIVTSSSYFIPSLMYDWEPSCVSYSRHTGYIVAPELQSMSPLFLADNENESNLRPLYSCTLLYIGKIQDSFISTVRSTNEQYTCIVIGYAWVIPQIGGTPTPCV